MTDLYEETDEIRCPMCDTVHDASYDGSVPEDGVCDRVDLECGHCTTRFVAERLVIVRYRLVPAPSSPAVTTYEQHVGRMKRTSLEVAQDSVVPSSWPESGPFEIDCEYEAPTSSCPSTVRSVHV